MDTRVIYTQLLSSIQFPPFLAMEYIATQPAVESPEPVSYTHLTLPTNREV